MMTKLVFVLSLLVAVATALPADFGEQLEKAKPFNGTIWAVLVAGSNEYYNYRHQADICHAYQIVHEHGIPDKNIIVFMYDDIAKDPQNPTPGIIINKPNGPDVYKGVLKDYIGEDVTPKNFLAALQGDKELEAAGKKVVKSGPNDHIFVYFADHGAPGLIAFPSDELYATDLNKALKNMHTAKKYSKLVFYVEACESGSMFEDQLPKNINIYATTAANATESSYACYYDDKRQTYLGDVYSVKFLEDSDKASLEKETLEAQFQKVKKETSTSHCQEYGDLSIAKLPVGDFQGVKTAKNQPRFAESNVITDAVDSGDVPLKILENKMKDQNLPREERTLATVHYQELVIRRQLLTNHVSQILQHINGTNVNQWSLRHLQQQKQPIRDHECYQKFVKAFDQNCFDLSKHPHALRHLYVFVNFCQHPFRPVNEPVETQVERMVNYCRRAGLNNMNLFPTSIL